MKAQLRRAPSLLSVEERDGEQLRSDNCFSGDRNIQTRPPAELRHANQQPATAERDDRDRLTCVTPHERATDCVAKMTASGGRTLAHTPFLIERGCVVVGGLGG